MLAAAIKIAALNELREVMETQPPCPADFRCLDVADGNDAAVPNVAR